MNQVALLNQRLDEIGRVVSRLPGGLGLLALGSCGLQQQRMDAYSDLDFFVITGNGYKARLLADLDWLAQIAPVAWCFRNTDDGYKLLFKDGVFCEFAIFEGDELTGVDYLPGRFVWRDDSLPSDLANSPKTSLNPCRDEAFLLGELITNLYVGLGRLARGEGLSAMRFVQIYAVDRLISLLDLQQQADGDIDLFCPDRRAEQRWPEHKALLYQCSPGVAGTAEAAAIMLRFAVAQYGDELSLVGPNSELVKQVEKLLKLLNR